jgi:hypothetical protein
MTQNAEYGSTDPESAWAKDVEQLLGVPHGDQHFWLKYHSDAYFHAAITVIRHLRQIDRSVEDK